MIYLWDNVICGITVDEHACMLCIGIDTQAQGSFLISVNSVDHGYL